MLTIRPVTPEDTSPLAAIHDANESKRLVPAGYRESFLKNAFDPGVLSLVATLGDDVVACGTVHYMDNVSIAWLSFGLVHPSWQRRGIGSAMILSRLSLLRPRAEGVCEVYLSATQNSQPFFARHGFAIIGEDGDAGGNLFHTMRFPLTAALRSRCEAALIRSMANFPLDLAIPTQRTRVAE
jgi:N-acetylglutamate synthase-like GNAT family acetyltransferase